MIMDTEKPFKTIEVIDKDTKQICKIACMSCIRGHRTTSCGIPVCRSKIFWTVKRPGRPSNSCTCRFNASGVCKCVTTIPKCPHKAKKGEKRSSECRCDEQGRFCCLLDSEQWDSLLALQKPYIQFFPTREALEMWQSGQSAITSPSTPGMSYYGGTPQRTSSCCGTSTTTLTPRMSRSIAPSPVDTVTSPISLPRAPRLGFMGIGAPMGPNTSPPPDVLVWNNEVPIAPREYRPIQPASPEAEEVASCCQSRREPYQPPLQNPMGLPLHLASRDYQPASPEAEEGSCCQGRSEPYQPPLQNPMGLSHQSYSPMSTEPYTQPYSAYSAPQSMLPSAQFNFDRWQHDYQAYQFPNAICQNCGLNGCTCRSCPPLMQNFGTTSWAQSCGRRHARIAPAPPASTLQSPLQPTVMQPSQQHQHIPQQHTLQPTSSAAHANGITSDHDVDFDMMDAHSSVLDQDFGMSGSADPLEYSDFLINELDRPSHVHDDGMFGG